MNIFQSVRKLFGAKTEAQDWTPIDDLDIAINELKVAKAELQKAQDEYDEINSNYSLKMRACDVLIEKGDKGDVVNNKKFLADRFERITDEFLDNALKLKDKIAKATENKGAIESDIIAKAVEIVAQLDETQQGEIKKAMDEWSLTKQINGKKVLNKAKAITLVLEEIVKGGVGSGRYKRGFHASHLSGKKLKTKTGELKVIEGPNEANPNNRHWVRVTSGNHRGYATGEEFLMKEKHISKYLSKSHEPAAIENAGKGDVKTDLKVEGHYANAIVYRTFKEGEKYIQKILFLKRASNKKLEPNKFCLPGGHIDAGETIEQATLRELKEEANLDASGAYILGKAKCADGKYAFYADVYGSGEVALLDGESINATWMSQEEWIEADLIFDLKQHLIALLTSSRNINSIPDILKKGEDEFDMNPFYEGFEDEKLEKGEKKKGEGSRGGHIIGHTKSGKPIYGTFEDSKKHKHLSKEEHIEAAELHEKIAASHKKKSSMGSLQSGFSLPDDNHDPKKSIQEKTQRDEAAKHHKRMANRHRVASNIKADEEKRSIEKTKKHSTDQLASHAENTSSDQLKKVADKKDHPHSDAAKRELERRAGEEAKLAKDKEEGAKQDEDFMHHRMMAGYHDAMEEKLGNSMPHLKDTGDKELEAIAKDIQSRIEEHSKLAEDFRNKAKEMHNPERHGKWNESAPDTKAALRYGKEALKKRKK